MLLLLLRAALPMLLLLLPLRAALPMLLPSSCCIFAA
jgi:hypothetical protein